MIHCWCEDDIPPWSTFWIKSVMNPIATEPPVAIVTRPGLADTAGGRSKESPIAEGDLTLFLPTAAFSYSEGVYPATLYTANLVPNLLTNGIAAIPAKSVFPGISLLTGIHWLGYDAAKSDPEHRWFFPRNDTWYLGSMIDSQTGDELEAYGQSADVLAHRVHGVAFRRIGLPDTINRCVAVVMQPLVMNHTAVL